MGSFRCIEHAARFQSSLVGTTTFQQCSVTHQLMRAMAAHRCEHVLRGHGPKSDGTRAATPKKMAEVCEAEMLASVRALEPGQRVEVHWDDGACEVGRVVEVCDELLRRPTDIRVRIRYEDRVLYESLAHRHWRVVR